MRFGGAEVFGSAVMYAGMQVWDVLTDYEALPEFVPNLALCERLAVPPALGTRLTRLRQVHCCLHILYVFRWALSQPLIVL